MTEQRDAFLADAGDGWFRRNPGTDTAKRHYESRLLSYVEPSSSVLEVGCSDGRRLAALAELVPGRFVGIDPSTEAISAGRDRWPHLQLHVGSADALPFKEKFDLVILGFFLYLCDRALLPQIVAETDRVLRDGGTLAIIDFDPRYPRRRPYRHRPGLWSFKMDYASVFLGFPSYALAEKVPFHHGGDGWEPDETDRIALNILRKDLAGGYFQEDEPLTGC